VDAKPATTDWDRGTFLVWTKHEEQSTKIHTDYFAMLNGSNLNAYVGLGSNLGDRAGNLLLGLRGMIDAGLEIIKLSSIYETEAVETFAQPAFLNMVAQLRGNTLPRPEELMARLLRIENSLGRTREVVMGPRLIDLDLLLYGDEISNTQFLTLPHARFHRRRFVLVPLAEVAPRLVHPTLHKTISELLEELEDDSGVKPWGPAASVRERL
jgi:2-amino-4-hydroxy-6-hydroxymethyldihydropteridine diphosphokinase